MGAIFGVPGPHVLGRLLCRLADDIVRGEEVALKVCRTRDANGNDIRPQLRQEFRCQACLQHPNILPVYEEIPHGEHHIFVTQPAKVRLRIRIF